MFPGDMQLGASLANVVNCRCSSRYFVTNADGTEEELAATVRGTARSPNREAGRVTHPSLITREIRLRDNMRERVFLTDMVEAIVSVRGGVIRVTRPGHPWRLLARGRYTHGVFTGARIRDLEVSAEGQGLGIERLIEASQRATNTR